MWTWIVIIVIVYAIWKKPGGIARLANDTLKFELFKELRARGAERESQNIPSVEHMEERFTRRLVAASAAVFATSTGIFWSTGTTYAVLIATVCAALYASTVWRVTAHRRNVVLPLYLTLCRMPGARWDPRANPTRWIRIPRTGRDGTTSRPILLRLPKDWHANAMGVRMIEEIVKQRVPGEWKMKVDRPRFLLTFVPTGAIAVNVGEEAERAPIAVDLEKEEFEIESKEQSPW